MFEAYRIGDPLLPETELGPLASQSALVDLHSLVSDAVQKGAICITGGQRCERPGFYYEPTILTGVTHHMDIYSTEVFGPVVTIAPFDTIEEAITMANDSHYGLGASIWTKNITDAKKIAGALDTGTVFVNSMVRSDPRLPYGGAKKSGYGREFSDIGLKEFTNIKSVVIK
jgi:succinate-semialdehyde dehydrogenase/glutarate-semialdehyde dehydrogenase